MSSPLPKKPRWLALLSGISCGLNRALVSLMALRSDRQTILDNRQDAAD